jgi:hypothetical protein
MPRTHPQGHWSILTADDRLSSEDDLCRYTNLCSGPGTIHRIWRETWSRVSCGHFSRRSL